MAIKVYQNWEEVQDTWGGLDKHWEEVYILQGVAEIIRGGGGAQAYVDNNPWDITKRKIGEEKTKKFVEIVCRINDLDFKKVYETKEINVSASQIQKTFRETIKIEIKL